FAFSLGAGMNLAEFFNFSVLSGGLTLALLTFICTAITGIAAFKLFKEKSIIAPISEASTAGNAVSTPAAVVAAASTALANGNLTQSEYEM
ncbi:2-keto-3-deoxygluconate permease, partial [Staphylococcus aureus]|nr:2-keto-3-deoxygluconate permease [Staphylococcus aureus]